MNIKVLPLVLISILGLGVASPSTSANICPTKKIIFDGCTVPQPDLRKILKPFRSLFKKSCNQHDKDYQTLGMSRSAADSNFKHAMKKDCKKLWIPGVVQACQSSAQLAFLALRKQSDANYYDPNQQKMSNHAVSTNINVQGNLCNSTPEHQSIYHTELLNIVNANFSSIVKRKPTAYERFKMLSYYDWTNRGDYSAFKNDVNHYAYSRRGVSVPLINHVTVGYADDMNVGQNTMGIYTSLLNSNGVTYNFKTNYGSSQNDTFIYDFENLYDQTYRVSGSLKVTDNNGNRDFKMFKANFFAQGDCSSGSGRLCEIRPL